MEFNSVTMDGKATMEPKDYPCRKCGLKLYTVISAEGSTSAFLSLLAYIDRHPETACQCYRIIDISPRIRIFTEE